MVLGGPDVSLLPDWADLRETREHELECHRRLSPSPLFFIDIPEVLIVVLRATRLRTYIVES